MKGESQAAAVTVCRVLPATAAEIFECWTRPELLMQWMSPYAGEVLCQAESDVRVGGRFKLSMRGPDKACEITGEYVDIDRPRRLVFSWCGPPTDHQDTLVTVELRPVTGATELRLTHERLPTSGMREGHEAGWTIMFDHLGAMIDR